MAKKYRDTRQRTAIRKVLAEADQPLQPKEIRDRASLEIPNLGIATVYRNLRSLVDDEVVEHIELPGQKSLYSMPRKAKYPFLLSVDGQRLEVFDKVQLKIPTSELPDYFKLHHYEVIFYGEFDRG